MLIYTLLGVFVSPGMVQGRVISLLQAELGRPTRIAKVEVNPLVLSLSVQGFEVRDTDDVKLAAFDGLFVNLQLSSLFHRAWTFSAIRLENPCFLFECHAEGDSRTDRLLADLANVRPLDADDEQQTGDRRPGSCYG
jgi:hypothetical protein